MQLTLEQLGALLARIDLLRTPVPQLRVLVLLERAAGWVRVDELRRLSGLSRAQVEGRLQTLCLLGAGRGTPLAEKRTVLPPIPQRQGGHRWAEARITPAGLAQLSLLLAPIEVREEVPA